MKQNSKKTLKHYIHLRLGKGSLFETLRMMFIKSFQANSVKEFWNYWNPLFGYFTLFFIYKPLTKKVPRAVRVLTTFTLSGFFLHDILLWWPFCWLIAYKTKFPLGTVMFIFLAIIMLVFEKIGFTTKQYPVKVRIISNVSYIFVSFVLTIIVGFSIQALTI